jgi:hypothetical protein
MATTKEPDEHERAAAGMDFEENDPIRQKAAAFGNRIVSEGPEAIADEIENLLPESWREQIRQFPFAAVALGVGVGVWLGLRKSDEIIAAGTSLISAAAMANVTDVMDRMKQG